MSKKSEKLPKIFKESGNWIVAINDQTCVFTSVLYALQFVKSLSKTKGEN